MGASPRLDSPVAGVIMAHGDTVGNLKIALGYTVKTTAPFIVIHD